MSQNLRNYLVAVFGLEAVITAAPESAWTKPSPCEGWTARDVAGHAMGVVSNVAARAGIGELCDPFADPGELAGTDVVASWRATRNRLLEALDQAGALQQQTEHPLGTMTIDTFLNAMLGDALIHTWDVARATGGCERLDPDAAAVALRGLEARDPQLLRAPGRYGPAATPIGDDPPSRLLAFSGRRL